MAASSLLALIDDIAATLDDVAVMTKVAAKKTAGVLGDDLALNAKQVTGVNADRELPVVWAVAKGSVVNKVILIPAALLISQFLPWLVTPLLMFGGLFLCYEGCDKIFEKLFHPKAAPADGHLNLPEAEKIKGAVRTDFILSAEIIAITLGTVAQTVFLNQVLVLVGISVGMTVGVYGLVAGIVKIDDLGLYLVANVKSLVWLGNGLLKFAPLLMRFLGVAGTAAMFLVGGGIISHGIPWIHAFQEGRGVLYSSTIDLVVGLLSGVLAVLIVSAFRRRPKN